MDLVVPILAAVVQLVAVGFLLTESWQRLRAAGGPVEMMMTTRGRRAPSGLYTPLSTRMINRSKSIRGWSRVGRRGSRDFDSKEHFALSGGDGSPASSRASTPSIVVGDESELSSSMRMVREPAASLVGGVRAAAVA